MKKPPPIWRGLIAPYGISERLGRALHRHERLAAVSKHVIEANVEPRDSLTEFRLHFAALRDTLETVERSRIGGDGLQALWRRCLRQSRLAPGDP